jgi:hypothetical protein
LGRYNVKSRDVREGGTGANLKGYTRADLYEPWSRYIRDMGDMPVQPCRVSVADDESGSATGSTSDVAAVAAVAAVAEDLGMTDTEGTFDDWYATHGAPRLLDYEADDPARWTR